MYWNDFSFYGKDQFDAAVETYRAEKKSTPKFQLHQTMRLLV